MDNFYDILQVNNTSSFNDINLSYKNKLLKYIKLQQNETLSSDQIKEIKLLKVALYILTNPNLRTKYDILLKKQNNKNLSEETNKDFLPSNIMEDSNLDNVFNIDNTWMNQINNNNSNNKKNRVDANLLGERVFSLPNFAKKQNSTSDIDIDLRKPIQGREDRTKQ